VLSFSEQAQEPWAPEIPARVIRASYLVTRKGPDITWVVPNWERLSRNVTMSVWHSNGVWLQWNSQITFSLSVLLRMVSPLGNREKALSPL
jgi:hypothetical protein